MAHLLAIFLLLLAAIMGMTDVENACGDDPPLKITTKRDSDKVEVTIEADKAVISVHSPCGISQAVIERSGNDWPSSVLLRLHLKGLENFKAANGTLTLEAAVSSQDGKGIRKSATCSVAEKINLTSAETNRIVILALELTGRNLPACGLPVVES